MECKSILFVTSHILSLEIMFKVFESFYSSKTFVSLVGFSTLYLPNLLLVDEEMQYYICRDDANKAIIIVTHIHV